MLFNSLVFLIFGALFYAGWPMLRRFSNVRWGYLVVASFVFYGWWDWRFLILIVASGLLDFIVGLAIERYPLRRKLLLAISIVGNVGSLATFKYLTFLTINANQLLAAAGAGWHIPLAELTLPVGISFYTFQSMSYTIDIYRGSLRPTRNILHFFAYLSMFPQLVAGPIIRAADLLPQLESGEPATQEQRWNGLVRIVHGYFKKVVIADNLAPAVNAAFAGGDGGSALYWWLVVTMFAFQIYCDFSGYSDIARGLANWMGYHFPENFNHPYIARSLRDFWTRWHISLSTWFRDYVYIPLGGSKQGKFGSLRNMWITMVVSGLWHGAAWTFVIWGGIHAFCLMIERLTDWPRRISAWPGGRYLASAVLLTQVWVAWVFFRAASLGQALDVVGHMFASAGSTLSEIRSLGIVPLAVVAGAIVREGYFYFGMDGPHVLSESWRRRLDPLFLAMAITACIFLRGPGGAFIYFQF
ncbi:MAG: MBOAT family protein [Phycisphaerales bacterium]|nr:MBOAT family protein [Phycisphaerales bacterium]